MTIKRYEPEKKCPIFEKVRKHPKKTSDPTETHIIRFSILENPAVKVLSSYTQKCGILHFLLEEKFILFVFSFPGRIMLNK